MNQQGARHTHRSGTNSSRREQLLNAAARLILEKGAGHLTLDAVCDAAHVSKGGLLYHFDSKTALLEALVDDLTAQLEKEVDQQLRSDVVEGIAGARAYLRAIAHMGELPRAQQLCKALTFICAAHPEYADRIRGRVGERSRLCWSKQMSLEELHLCLLADGLWLADIYGTYRITSERRVELLERCGCADT
ncbi:TetR/AcrR family transcriptional regulator [Peristeroidobacter soli]|uniref:TetR/AcrR family transcriptional regulator n=1 Tax=Peristeroidobacter soli TaxID=2497877 RepID=UPI0015891230|nr:TetR/AcrR family transcriptional regulator [Peristeroidobacter soli]